jgi:hypothetical protein
LRLPVRFAFLAARLVRRRGGDSLAVAVLRPRFIADALILRIDASASRS